MYPVDWYQHQRSTNELGKPVESSWHMCAEQGALQRRRQDRVERSGELASRAVKKLPSAGLVPEGFTGDEAFELASASATVCLFYAAANQAVILTAQVVVRVNVPWFSVKRFARWAQCHTNVLL
jgi:hypothetical protein